MTSSSPTASGRSRPASPSSGRSSTPTSTRADRALREGGGRLRIRVQNGRTLATFKRSLEGAADGVRRREEVEGPAEGDPEASDAFRAARALSGAPLEPVGTLHTDRTAREYRARRARRRGGDRPAALSGRQRPRPVSRPRATRSPSRPSRASSSRRSPASSRRRRRRAPSSSSTTLAERIPGAGFEPARLSAAGFKPAVSHRSTTRARQG